MKQNKRIVVMLLSLVLFMGAASFMAVPFYNWFCKVTGYGGTTAQVTENTSEILDQTITVRFDASKAREMPWEFKPAQRTMKVRLGETALAFYEAYNPSDRVVAGTASYNVTPYSAGNFFNKIDCFCFEMQVLQPGERVQMPVTFYVDPEIINHREAKFVKEITLSYTFYETELPDDQVSMVNSPKTAKLN